TAKYRDATGRGSMGHLSPWTARVDYAAKHLAGPAWLNATIGGTWGKGAAAVAYDDLMLTNTMDGADNPKVTASTWSAYLGPSLQIDGSREFDFFITLAPATLSSTSDAFDPFRAYGATLRIHFMSGPDPGPMNWG